MTRPDDKTDARFRQEVARKVRRKMNARGDQGAMFWLGMFGLVGWSIAIPTLAGVALGSWLDKKWPGDVSWTLSFLFIGVILGCMNAWYWIKQEHDHDQ